MALPISYNVRNLRVRWQVTLLAIIGIALVVAVFVVLGAMAAGFRIALASTGRTDNVMVLQKGADGEMTSGIPRSGTSLMSVDSRVARDAKGQPLASPEILIVAPCGYGLDASTDSARKLPKISGVKVFAVDANAYFARPGPRVAEGIELLAHLLHPSRYEWPHDHKPWAEV